MNPANGGGELRGNAIPTIGTGTTFYTQFGYMLPRKNEKFILQPYIAFSHNRLEGVQNVSGTKVPVNVLDVGGNLYLAGHHAKLTLNYRNRPDFTDIESIRYRPEITLQGMIYL